MLKENYNQLVTYQFESLHRTGQLKHGIFTRLGGVSSGHLDSLNTGSTVGDDIANVIENRERAAASMGVCDADTRTSWQIHSADVLVLHDRKQQDWPPPKADAIVTALTGLPLEMRFADCTPLILFDPVQKVLALAHAGWRGTVAKVGAATIETMGAAFGSRPEDILAGIGPAIGPCCYEVGPEVVEQVEAAFTDGDKLFSPSPQIGRNPHFDLWAANHQVLAEAGVEHIETAGICTSCNTHEFYSHRAEKGKTGRFGMIALLTGESR